MNFTAIESILNKARQQQRMSLLETEGMEILKALGIQVPHRILLRNSSELNSEILSGLQGKLAVIKVVSHEILHKSDLGGVKIVENRMDMVRDAILDMERRFAEKFKVTGYSISECIPYDSSLGNELLLGMRWTEDFGAVITLSAGGIFTEFLASHFREGRDAAVLSPSAGSEKSLAQALSQVAVVQLATRTLRGQKPRIALTQITEVVQQLFQISERLMPSEIKEFEINPLVISEGKLIALDALVTLAHAPASATALSIRPAEKIRNLLEPRTIAVMGVSEKMNPGRTIVENILHQGFDPSRLYIIKPGMQTLAGCPCVPSISALPGKVDLLVLAVSAKQIPDAITEVAAFEKAESVIAIPGGLEEKQGTQAIVSSMNQALENSRRTTWKGPVINGGNCLGIRSVPGKYNTLFIPPYKLPLPTGPAAPLAFLSQSGAFAVSKSSKLGAINPKYTISIGNQMDLTVGDYLDYLKSDLEIQTYAVYVEGFKALDGLKFIRAAREIVKSGRTVILYRAGRTLEGAHASASHTASIAGNYAVTRGLCQEAGVLLAETVADFEDLTKMFVFLGPNRHLITGRQPRLGAISNAGFECVAFADNLGSFTLPAFEGTAQRALEESLDKAGLSSIVDVHNPVDLTPMTNDAGYDRVIRTVLTDSAMDAVIVGIVPLTPATMTLSISPAEHSEDLMHPDALALRLARIKKEFTAAGAGKPWVAVVDAGELYDAFAYQLERFQIPTFRTADRALRILNAYFMTSR
ncbi:MAG: hypothetical protein A2X97_04710 [Bdellovibrionales bacterium GWA1_52_35]|nr:MAG: hypothetical protein A2X97_04710 [Bdellovibrionales bacterium GWA1_52_35]HCM38460.1 hypothetical protein [Bdellovibrionales bacterium]